MPEPDPGGIEIEEHDGGGYAIYTYGFIFGKENMKHRRARTKAIEQNMRWGRWRCWCCGEPVPV